jgi:hypothetical protein
MTLKIWSKILRNVFCEKQNIKFWVFSIYFYFKIETRFWVWKMFGLFMKQTQVFLYLNIFHYSVYLRGLEVFLTDFTLAIPLPDPIPLE